MTTENGEGLTETETLNEEPETTEKTTEETAAEEKPEFVPLTSEALKFPEEGFIVDEALRDGFLELVNNQEMSPADRAQGLVDLHLKAVQQASEKSSEGFAATQLQWREQAQADPEIGGDKLDGVLATVSKAINQFGSPELREAMDLTGAGNHPAVIKFLHKMAKHFEEGTPVSGGAASGGQTLADKMFPSMTKA